MRARPLGADVQNALDFLAASELALYTNQVSLTSTRLSWRDYGSGTGFLRARGPATVEQYLAWVRGGEYSGALRDGSLLQITYDVQEDVVVGHRLAYVPCPVIVDEEWLTEGEPIADVVSVSLDDVGGVTLRTPVRFDFDAAAARPGHPAAHFSINSDDCRVACIAPLHPYRFVDFVYRHFYPRYRRVHESWFESASRRRLGNRVIGDADRETVHLAWPAD